MRLRLRSALAPAIALALAAGCNKEGPPGAGLTNGPPPDAPDKPASRIDLPGATDLGPDRELETAVSERGDGGGRNDAGTGGRGGGNAGAESAKPTPGAGEKSPPRADVPGSAQPPKIEASSPGGAQGGTKPADKIEAGTPRSPQ